MPHATYDPALSSDADWVRFLAGDKDVANPRLDDAEIEALLAAEQSNGKSGGQSSQVYLAAARAVEQMFTRWQVTAQGIVETQIGGLRLKRGDGSASREAIDGLVQSLRTRGNILLMGRTRPAHFRVL